MDLQTRQVVCDNLQLSHPLQESPFYLLIETSGELCETLGELCKTLGELCETLGELC